eukprot:8330373-Lingulodinium_polyedra.AAC.1
MAATRNDVEMRESSGAVQRMNWCVPEGRVYLTKRGVLVPRQRRRPRARGRAVVPVWSEKVAEPCVH